jgi:hypothetical protein
VPGALDSLLDCMLPSFNTLYQEGQLILWRGYWTTPTALAELQKISSWYKHRILRQAAIHGPPTIQTIREAHLDQNRAAAAIAGPFLKSSDLSKIAATIIAVFAALIDRHTPFIAAVLAVLGIIVIYPQLREAMDNRSLPYQEAPQNVQPSGQIAATGGAAIALDHIVDLLTFHMLTTAAFQSWLGQTRDAPVTAEAIRCAWRRTQGQLMSPVGASDSQVQSTRLVLQRSIGAITFAMPLALLAVTLISGDKIPGSLSLYYFTSLRNLLVVGYCCAGALLVLYTGYGILDNIFTTVAGIGFLGAGLFPTFHPESTGHYRSVAYYVHDLSLIYAFLAMAVVALLFTQKGPWRSGALPSAVVSLRRALIFRYSPDTPPAAHESNRNVFYTSCAWFIVICTILLGLPARLQPGWTLDGTTMLYWLETFAMCAIGTSWLVKAQVVPLADARIGWRPSDAFLAADSGPADPG